MNQNVNDSNNNNESIDTLIPKYIQPYIYHYYEDFWLTSSFEAVLIAHLMYEGFLPIAGEMPYKFKNQIFLLPKLHLNRCILYPNKIHIPKSIKKRSKKYKMTFNASFDQVIKGCHEQHGIPWLYPPIVDAFKYMYNMSPMGFPIQPTRFPYYTKDSNTPTFFVHFYSIELWLINNDDINHPVLVAGELGYSIGTIYTSLTGFSRQSGAGTMQLYALGSILSLLGYDIWDLGMGMKYKYTLGAIDIPRKKFLQMYHTNRTKSSKAINIKNITDQENSDKVFESCKVNEVITKFLKSNQSGV